MNWKKYLALSVSVFALLGAEQVIQACADYNHYDEYPQFFGNQISAKPAFKPFNFIASDLYYDDTYWWWNGENDENTLVHTEQINRQIMLEEWCNYTDKSATIEDINEILFKQDKSVLQAIADNKGLSTALSNNSFVKFLSQKKQKALMDYLLYAKDCEVFALDNNDSWDETEEKKVVPESYKNLQSVGLSKLKSENDNFLKMKYAFQTMRLAFNNKKYDEVKELYIFNVANKVDRSVACTRNIGYYAGAMYRTGDKIQAGYYYTKMFDNSDAYKFEAMLSFEWSRKKYNDDGVLEMDRFENILNKCQTNHEKAVAYVMKGLRAYPESGLEDMEKAYALDPEVRGIDVIFNREINKIEREYFSNKVYAFNQLKSPKIWHHNIRPYEYEESNAKMDSLNNVYGKRIKALNAFADKLIVDKKSGTPAVWNLCKAYLACMQNNVSDMKSFMDKAKQSGMNSNETTVYNMIDLLHSLYKSQKITTEIENEILPKLKSLDALAKKDQFADFQFRDVMRNVVAGKYFQQGDTAKGVYAMAHAYSWDKDRAEFVADIDFQDMQGEVLSYMSFESLKKVQDYRSSASQSNFDKWLVNQTYYIPAVLKELEGTMYLRKYDFKNAVRVLEQNGIEQKQFANPFMPQINDYIELYAHDTAKIYTKLSFSKRMAELQDIIETDPNDAGALYGYAVALFNISYYGKAADMVAYNRIPTDDHAYYKEDDDNNKPRFLQEFYRVYTAEQYFNKAAAVATDSELKAKALWGAAKCWGKRCPSISTEERYFWDENVYFVNGLKNPYFAKLKSSLSQTSYVQKIRSSCDYYAKYVRRK